MSLGCVTWGCEKIAYTRGLCHSHYQAAARRVRAKETTWEKEERAGRCRPALVSPYRRMRTK